MWHHLVGPCGTLSLVHLMPRRIATWSTASPSLSLLDAASSQWGPHARSVSWLGCHVVVCGAHMPFCFHCLLKTSEHHNFVIQILFLPVRVVGDSFFRSLCDGVTFISIWVCQILGDYRSSWMNQRRYNWAYRILGCWWSVTERFIWQRGG